MNVLRYSAMAPLGIAGAWTVQDRKEQARGQAQAFLQKTAANPVRLHKLCVLRNISVQIHKFV